MEIAAAAVATVPAELVLGVAGEQAWHELAARHGRPHCVVDGVAREAQFGIVAYDGPYAVVELSVKIVYQSGGRIAAATVFGSKVQAAAATGAQATLALDQAFSEVLVQMVKWTSRRI